MFNRIFKSFPVALRFSRNFTVTDRNLTKLKNEHRVVASSDGQTIVCWHPEIPFPYENSLPINFMKPKSNSVLKVQNLEEVMSIFGPKKEEFVRQELMELTHTCKNRWFPKSIHKRRRKRPTEYARPYL